MPPSAGTLLWYRLYDQRRWIFGGLGFLLVFGFYITAWNAVGRDPKKGTIIPLFHPPAGVSPALANYIRDWGFGREKWRAFTAAALSLAVRGLVRFNQTGKALTLEATGKQAGRRLHEPAARRARDPELGQRDGRRHHRQGARRRASPRPAKPSPRTSSPKTATASSAAISAT